MNAQRQASTLIVVSGLAMLMLSMGLAFLMRMRGDAQQAGDVLKDAQARVMLVAAMSYVCECSRIGWGKETFGWNDVRDHSPGPRTLGPVRSLPNGALTWAANDPWPAPGSIARCPMYVMERPPYAIKPLTAPNPIMIVAAGEPIPDGGYQDSADGTGRIIDKNGVAFANDYGANSIHRIGDFSRPDPVPAIAIAGETLPLPAVRYPAFRDGDPTPRIATREQGWFRVYREDPRDHNGVDDANYEDPYYDTIDINQGTYPNVSVFVVACGSGATLACRDFSEAQVVYPGLFFDQRLFDLARSDERIYWYRVEWTPFLGDNTQDSLWENQSTRAGVTASETYLAPNPPDVTWSYSPVGGHFGSIRWIQRLDREPPRW
ncbi:MAG: hypothetical protein H0W72_00165 [Planctomycetes bacterium]|nr:hypothetical protein [Planctomycetota bacterium]